MRAPEQRLYRLRYYQHRANLRGVKISRKNFDRLVDEVRGKVTFKDLVSDTFIGFYQENSTIVLVDHFRKALMDSVVFGEGIAIKFHDLQQGI